MNKVPATRRIELDGGAIVLLEESHLVPLVSMNVALRSGSAYDPKGLEGLYRLTGRMLRRGSQTRSAREIEDELDRLGSEVGIDASGSSFSFGGTVIGRNFERFIDLVADLTGKPAFPEDELARLKRETAAELVEARDSDRSLAQRAFRRFMYPDHPYGRFASGTLESVAKVEVADVKKLHDAHFKRGNAILTFSGDLTEAQAIAASERILANFGAGPALADLTTDPPEVPGRRLVFVDKPERTQTQILFGAMGTWPHDPDHTALLISNAVFGGTFTSRLMQEVRAKRGWSYGTSSRLAVDRHRQSFSMWTFPAAADAAPCIALELDLLTKFVNDGITPKELAFIKKYLARSYAFEIDTASKRVHQALDVEVLNLPADYYTGHIEHVEAVTLEAARDAVKQRIHPDNLLIVVVGTASEILEDVKKAIPNLASTEVVPFDAL